MRTVVILNSEEEVREAIKMGICPNVKVAPPFCAFPDNVTWGSLDYGKRKWNPITLKEYKRMNKIVSVGDVLENEDYSWTQTVVAVAENGDRRFTITEDSDDGALNAYAGEDFGGWTLKDDTTELTLQEIADKFGVSVDKVRIKE